MASREKRQINFLPDNTSGTVNISHGSSPKPQNSGFFGSGFTNTTSRSSSKRRRLRIADKQRRENEARQQQQNAIHQAALQAQAAVQAEQAAQAQREAQARIAAEAQARAHAEAQARAEAEAQARAHAEAQVRAAAQAQAERERVQAAHRQAVNSLSQAQPAVRADLDQKHYSARAALAELLQSQVQGEAPASSGTGQQLLEAILKEKARVNYLIAQKSGLREQKLLSAYSFAGADPRGIDGEQYKAILLSRSTTAEQAHQVHTAWTAAYADALEVLLLSESEDHLNLRSEVLSKAYAEQAWTVQNDSGNDPSHNTELSIRQASELGRLWSVIAGPSFPTQETPTVRDRATEIAKQLFIKRAMKTFARTLPHIAAFYPTELGNGETPPAALATSASPLGISSDLDLDFIASRRGTVDVSHRIGFTEVDNDPRAVWTETDGVSVGTKVRVRSLVFNPDNKTYEFLRDGESVPSLVWTPAITPESSSTYFPNETPLLPVDAGTDVSPVSNELGEYPTYNQIDFDDYIIVFPADSGLPPVYALFKSPRYLPGIVSGAGGSIDSDWQASASRNLGSPVPSVVADALRGRQYAEFRNLKRAIWREMSKHPEIISGMNERNIELIKQGKAPIAPRDERKGGRMRYEIHHIKPISQGGDVYGVDNMGFNSPANHDNIHSELRNGESH